MMQNAIQIKTRITINGNNSIKNQQKNPICKKIMPGILVNALMGLIIFGKINGQFLDHDGIEYPTLTPDNKEVQK